MSCFTSNYVKILIGSLILFLLSFGSSLLSQTTNLGFPLSDSFSPEEYNGSTQNWRIDLSDDGRIFFANNDGLLVFDGYDWVIHPLPKRSITRSVKYFRDTIYVGGQDEFGYFSEDSLGNLFYTSLWDLVPDSLDIADIWDIRIHQGKVVFRNSRNVFGMNKGVYSPLGTSRRASFLESMDSILLYNDYQEGVQILEGTEVKELGSFNDSTINVVSVLHSGEKWLIFTESNGVYEVIEGGNPTVWGTNAQSYLMKNEINTAIKLTHGGYAVATKLGGIVLLDEHGQSQYKINKSRGLPDNNVTDLIEDDAHNIWATTFFGVNRIRLNTGLFTFYPDGFAQGAVYDVKLWKNKWWFATVNGLFVLQDESYFDPFDDVNPILVEGTEGQVWGLDILDSQLYMAHHRGAFEVKEDLSIRNLQIRDGAWKFVKLKNGQIAIGGYSGIYQFDKNLTESIIKRITGFQESSRIMMVDRKGQLWVSHPYRGVFRFRFRSNGEVEEIKTFSKDSGFECELGNYIFEVDQTPVITNECGVYLYSYELERFKHFERFEAQIATGDHMRRIYDSQKGIWFISDLQTCRVDLTKDSIVSKYCISHIGNEYVGGFQNMYVLDSQEVVLCATRGLRLFNGVNTSPSPELVTYVRSLKVNGTEKIDVRDKEVLELGSSQRNLFVEFGTKGFIHQDLQGYEYRLDGFHEKWQFTRQPFVNLNNLEANEYTLYVRCIVKGGAAGKIFSSNIVIHEIWYKTKTVQAFFALIIIGIFFVSWLLQKRVYDRDTTSLIREKERTEDELEEVRAEKLQNELIHKNQELTSAILHLTQKQQTLTSVRSKIEELEKKVKNTEARREIKRLYSLFNSNDRLEDDWDRFSQLFNQVHVDFISRLKDKYPNLKPKDRKLCAFLRMNLSSKEIAPLLNISTRGVEISRYRLRKKLNMDTQENLTDVISSI